MYKPQDYEICLFKLMQTLDRIGYSMDLRLLKTDRLSAVKPRTLSAYAYTYGYGGKY